MPKICEMANVREISEGYPVELWRNDESGRLVVRAVNEDGNNCTEVDLWDLIQWFSIGPLLPESDHGGDFEGRGACT